MEDRRIIDLFWQRDETAIGETAKKYGKYCRSIAYAILHDDGDSDECVNDTWFGAWNAMPPHRPNVLQTFLGRLTRNKALDCFSRRCAEKRGSGQVPVALDELAECLSDSNDPEQVVDQLALQELLDRFLAALPAEDCRIFMRRYWYFRSIKEIAADDSMKESRVKMSLHRSRAKLKQLLKAEGFVL